MKHRVNDSTASQWNETKRARSSLVWDQQILHESVWDYVKKQMLHIHSYNMRNTSQLHLHMFSIAGSHSLDKVIYFYKPPEFL